MTGFALLFVVEPGIWTFLSSINLTSWGSQFYSLATDLSSFSNVWRKAALRLTIKHKIHQQVLQINSSSISEKKSRLLKNVKLFEDSNYFCPLQPSVLCLTNLFIWNWSVGFKDIWIHVQLLNIDFTTMSPRTSVVSEAYDLRFFCHFRNTCLSSLFKRDLLLVLHLFCFTLWTKHWYTTAARTRFSVISSRVKGGSLQGFSSL